MQTQVHCNYSMIEHHNNLARADLLLTGLNLSSSRYGECSQVLTLLTISDEIKTQLK